MKPTEEALDLQTYKNLFKKNADVDFQLYTYGQYKVHFITCDSMVNLQLLNEVIVPRVQETCAQVEQTPLEKTILEKLHIPELKILNTKEEVITKLFNGYLILFFEDENLTFSSNISKKPNRNPEESRMEVLIKVPRDNFIEDISVNIALIRKRLPTNSLSVEKMEIGRRSKTTVAILYMEDIASKEILQDILKQLNEIDVDILFGGELLMERVNKRSLVFPKNDYTGRPDFAMQALVRGRFLILVDGVSYVVITPVNLFLLLKAGEDIEYPVAFSTAERLLRIVGLMVGVALPAFWLALTTFHQDQMPFQLLATVVQNNTGLPLPSALEMLIMLIMFELFREAGLRLPSVIGGTISVVGGIIVGDAAIRAGLTSPAMIVVIAISTIATFTLVNQSLVTAVSVVRIIMILITSFLGLFGFFVSLYLLLLYLSNIRIFGVSYMNIATDLSWATIKKSLFRPPATDYKDRPNSLDPQDSTRLGGAEDEKKN
ncbi:spore germination protein [Psychrobacillus sp. FSL K6-2843]|uniref:spore germination protein n=1 Tax=Psychrobacillus sp. FSL K6-2843 TaxID=2921549 RepID=UPI00315AB1AD